jgi:hypothetical protein
VTWRVVARLVAAAHTSYALFVVFGSILVLFWPGLMWVHLAAVIWAGVTLLFDFGCPLTPWEKQAWSKGGVEPYDEGFLQHHLLRTRFKPANARRNHAVLGASVIVLNVIIYYFIFTRR